MRHKVIKWCYDSENKVFPPIRIVFLVSTCIFYFLDVSIDLFTAYEHYKAWTEGNDTALDFFVATMFFIICPTLMINVLSLVLYIWGQFVLTRKNLYESHGYVQHFHIRHMVGKEKLKLMKYEKRIRNLILEKCPKFRSAPSNVIELDLHAVIPSQQEQSASSTSSSSTESIESTCDTDGSSRVTGNMAVVVEVTDSVPEFRPLDEFTPRHFIVVVILHVLQLGFIFRVLRLLYLRRDGLAFDRYRDVSFLRLMEGFFEAAPQLLLQLFVITLEDITNPAREIFTGIAVVISMGSLALAIADYISSGKDILHYTSNSSQQRQRLSWVGYIIIILWHLSMIVSRGIAIALFATEYYLMIFVVGFAHYFLMVYWLYGHKSNILKTDDGNKEEISICGHYGFELLAAVFNVFFPFRLQNEDSLSFITSYYTVFFFENLLLIILWVVHVDYTQDLWYIEAAPVTVIVTFAMGIGFMILYYLKYQPKKCQSNEDSNEEIDFPTHQPLTITCTCNRLYCKEQMLIL